MVVLTHKRVSKNSLFGFDLNTRNESSKYLILSSLFGRIKILSNFEQKRKIPLPIEVIDDGIVICVSDEQP